jgi:hypothetical protein
MVSLSIPNDIREFWYNERPDILNYMQKAYKDLDIQFLPDSIYPRIESKKLTTDLSSTYDSLMTKTQSKSLYINGNIINKQFN